MSCLAEGPKRHLHSCTSLAKQLSMPGTLLLPPGVFHKCFLAHSRGPLSSPLGCLLCWPLAMKRSKVCSGKTFGQPLVSALGGSCSRRRRWQGGEMRQRGGFNHRLPVCCNALAINQPENVMKPDCNSDLCLGCCSVQAKCLCHC